MGRMPQEAPARDCSPPRSREAAGIVGMGIREEPQCEQDFGAMPDPPCVAGVAPEVGACAGPQGWCL